MTGYILLNLSYLYYGWQEPEASEEFTEEVQQKTSDILDEVDGINQGDFKLKVVKNIGHSFGNQDSVLGQFRGSKAMPFKNRVVISEVVTNSYGRTTESVIIHEFAHLVDFRERGDSPHDDKWGEVHAELKDQYYGRN